jgi:hypothetical protein
MRRRISLLLVSVLAGTTLTLLGPTRPASAWVVCGGGGAATVAPGLKNPWAANVLTGANLVEVLIGSANVVHAFAFGLTVGGCLHPPAPVAGLAAAGVLKGYCTHAAGIGTANGHLFAFILVGPLVILTGHLVGAFLAAPAPGTGSCIHLGTPFAPTFGLPAGAAVFTLVGGFVALNCTPGLQTSVPGTPFDTAVLQRLIDTDTLFSPLFHVSVHVGLHFWWNQLCIGPPVL